MLRSMTGFGRATTEADGMLWTIELTSVNSRFLDVQLRLPRALAGTEFALRKRTGERLKRGKVTITVTWETLPGSSAAVRVNEGLAAAYAAQLRALQEAQGLAGEVTVGLVAGLPDVFASALDTGERGEREHKLLAALDEALAALDQMRQTEGGRLAKDIVARLRAIRAELEAMGGEAETYARALSEKVRARIQQLFVDVAPEPQRVAQEAAFLAERADITEEQVRLSAHLDEFEQAMAKGGELGRRCNFLLQEMVRETNTIGSKTGELAVIQRVVRMKEELEKIREQVQNIE